MAKIKELFDKNIYRRIEEVIKVEQEDEETVRQEIQEYVATDALKEHFCTIYDAVAEYASNPHEGIGIWLSGFFGSGKSSFAKILGYTLANRKVGDKTASQLFMETVKDDSIANYLKNINSRIPIKAVIFDVSMDRGVTAGEKLTELMYKALLRKLGYAEDLDLAELEITLESKGMLDDFVSRFESTFKEKWDEERQLAFGIGKASQIIHEMMPETFSSPDSWSNSISKGGIGEFVGRADISPNELAERAFELAARRCPGNGIIFVIDEVGQYISRSVDKMLDLQGIVQAFGVQSKNLVKAGKAPAPCWIVVTSQEKLDEVVDALGDKQVELARLQDRFRITIDLKQSDIEEVAAKRVLSKTKEARESLTELYDEYEGRLKNYCALERTSRDTDISRDDFTNLYPYLPYQIDLSIDIVDGLRSKRAGQRHVGGSNRTIIKQTQQMLVHDRTKLAEAEVGSLVTLDKIYELLYAGNLLPSETTKEIDSIPDKLKGNDMAWKVAKVIALMGVVKDLPRTKHNIAAALHPGIASDSVQKEVEEAIEALMQAQMIRESEQGYKLLTLQEKHWATERSKKYPRPKEVNLLKEEAIKAVIEDAKIRTFQYKKLRSFKIGLNINGNKIEDGQISLLVRALDPEESLESAENQARSESREEDGKRNLYWVFKLTEEAHRLIVELYRSRSMISEYEQLRAQGKISSEEKACLEEEKTRGDAFLRKLKAELEAAMVSGAGFFQGVKTDAASLDDNLREILQKHIENAIPHLYTKLSMGAKPVKGNEPEKVLTAANLSGLPAVFYASEDGLNLVIKEEDRYVPNASAEIAREIMEYLESEYAYGNKVTGKILEAHFQAIPYGWELDVLRLVLAVLFRAGAIEVTSQGRKHKDFKEPSSHQAFTSNVAFRAATFAPRKAIAIKELSQAAEAYEKIAGQEVDVDEMSISKAMHELASSEQGAVSSLLTRMQAYSLPGLEVVKEFSQDLQAFMDCGSEECVIKLASEGSTFQDARIKYLAIKHALDKGASEKIARARTALNRMCPTLASLGVDEGLAEAEEGLKEMLADENVYRQLELLDAKASLITAKYSEAYSELHDKRRERYEKAAEELKGDPDWSGIDASDQERLLSLIRSCICEELLFDEAGVACSNCNSSYAEMRSDLDAVDGRLAQARAEMHEMIHPEQIEQVKVSTRFPRLIEKDEDVDLFLEELGKLLRKLLAEGKKVELQ